MLTTMYPGEGLPLLGSVESALISLRRTLIESLQRSPSYRNSPPRWGATTQQLIPTSGPLSPLSSHHTMNSNHNVSSTLTATTATSSSSNHGLTSAATLLNDSSNFSAEEDTTSSSIPIAEPFSPMNSSLPSPGPHSPMRTPRAKLYL